MEEQKLQEGPSDDLFEHHRIVVDPKQTAVRVDKFLMDRLEKVSRNKVQNACKSGYVRANDVPIKSNYKVRPNDVITIFMSEPPRLHQPVEGEEIPLDVVYEDDEVLIINKQAGLVVHPGVSNYSGTLVNGLVHYFKSKNLPVMAGNQQDRPGLVHRIDKDTSGLMVIAKTEEAITHLSKQFFDHTIEREYVALVWGDVEEPKGRIEVNLGRHPNHRTLIATFPSEDGGKHAVTHYEVLENLYYVTLVKCRLETGRTHQIRVHMKHIGHTLFSDAKYGGDKILKGTVFNKYRQYVENCFKIMPRQALHAKSLGFVHPKTNEKMYFESELPEDFASVLEKWRNYTNSRKDLLS